MCAGERRAQQDIKPENKKNAPPKKMQNIKTKKNAPPKRKKAMKTERRKPEDARAES